MKIRPFFLLLFIIAVTCNSEKKESPAVQEKNRPSIRQNDPPTFSQPWNKTFHLDTTETGEVLSIGAAFSDGREVFIYDLAENAVVALDDNLNVTSTVKLTSIGRKTYVGDDFVVKDSLFIFINGVDRRLELFHRITGKHLRSIPVPADLLAGVRKRSRRIVNRLFLDGDNLLIGNEYHLVPFDVNLEKRTALKTILTAPADTRWALYRKKEPVAVHDSLLKKGSLHAGFRVPETHHPVNGKQFFLLNNRLYSVTSDKDSVRIAEVK